MGRRQVRKSLVSLSKKSVVIPGRGQVRSLELSWFLSAQEPGRATPSLSFQADFYLASSSSHLDVIETFQGHGSLFTMQEQVRDKKVSE